MKEALFGFLKRCLTPHRVPRIEICIPRRLSQQFYTTAFNFLQPRQIRSLNNPLHPWPDGSVFIRPIRPVRCTIR